MNRKVLMVSTASRWLGTARMPRSLALAGFDVSLLAPRGSLALHSRFVSRSSVLRDESTPMQWLLSLVAMIKEVEPCLVVPCDEVAIRLLFELVRNPPGQTPPSRRLARGSQPNPRAGRASWSPRAFRCSNSGRNAFPFLPRPRCAASAFAGRLQPL